MMRAACALVALASLGASIGCAVGPRYRRPATQVTPTFRGQDRVEAASFADLPWWEAFADEPLDALINEALTNSYDLADATARADAARETFRASTDALLPLIGINGGPSYQQVFSSFSAALPAAAAGGPSIPTGNFHFPQYSAQATVSWEIDLWGRLRRLREAALADFFASEDNRRGVIVSIIAVVASDYYTLLSLDRQLEIAHRTVESRQETLDLFTKREAGGVGDRLQTESQQAILASAAATIPALERQIVATENQISIIVGRPPGPIRRGSLTTGPAPPPRPAGPPSALLERRPDVRQAEARVISANAQVGAAFAQLFPQINVGGNVGFASSSLPDLFTTGALTYGASLLVSWVAPLLAGAAIAHRYRAAEALWRATVADYRRAVLVALAETSNAIVDIEKLRDTRAQLEVAVRSSAEAVRLAKVRYNNGVASYLDVVQAEQNLFPFELQLASTIGQQFVSTTQLYRALGGGWQR